MKRIVICSDGTWNTPGQPAPTNVTRLARAVLPTAPDGTTQVVFYDAGIGTDGGWLTRLLGGVTGKGIEKNVGDGYRFLMHNYEQGDEIYLFGYSRGSLHGPQPGRAGPQRRLTAEDRGRPFPGRISTLPPPRRRAELGGGNRVSGRALPRGRHYIHRRLGHGRGARHPATRSGKADGGPPSVPRRRAEREREARLPCARHRRKAAAVQSVALEGQTQSGPDRRAGVVRRRARGHRRRLRRLFTRGWAVHVDGGESLGSRPSVR